MSDGRPAPPSAPSAPVDEAPIHTQDSLPPNAEDLTVLGRGRLARRAEAFDGMSLNVPLRIQLPEVFEVKDLLEGMEEVLERVVEEPKEAPLFERASEVDLQMEQNTPQFFLRNIPRVERIVEDALEYEHAETERLAVDGLLDEVRTARHEPPTLLDTWTVREVVAARDASAHWTKEADWTRYFGREVLEEVKGPRWAFDPDREVAPSESRERAPETPVEGQEESP